MMDEEQFSPISESDTGIDKGLIEETLYDMHGLDGALQGMCFEDKWPCANRGKKCDICMKIQGTPSEFKPIKEKK